LGPSPGLRRGEAGAAHRISMRATTSAQRRCRPLPVRDEPTERYIPALRSRTRCAPTRGQPDLYRPALCGSAPCARQTYGAVHHSVAVAHRVRSHRQAKREARHECAMRGQGRSTARPRFKSSGIRARCAALGSIPCVPSEVVPSRRASSVRAFPNTMLRAF